MASSQPTAEASNVANEQQSAVANRRAGVTVGPLPDDFLRVAAPQEQQDALLAQSLAASTGQHQQIPGHPLYATQMAYAPPNIVGRLVITIVQAKLIKNYSMFKNDPYVRMRVGHQVFETPTAHSGGKNPIWNKTIQCYLPIGCDKVDIDIFDEKSFGEDERIAWAKIDIPAPVYEGQTVEDFFPLSGRSGETAGAEGSIQLTFTLQTQAQMPPQRMMMAPGFAYIPQQYYPTSVPPGTVVPPGNANTPTARMYSDDDLKQVKEMFPEMDTEVVQSVLEAQGGNVQAAINALLEMNA